MNTATNIPPGFREDAQGRLIPEEQIRPIDKARDELVQEIVIGARVASQALAEFKARTFADIAAFVQLSAEQYGAKIGGQKGNVTLMSFDGRYKIQRAIAEHITFDERLQAAKGLIDECIVDWSQGSRPEVQTLINGAFEVDKEGNINTGRVLALRRLDIKDERWLNAMRAIAEAIQVVGSKSYIRVYERDEKGEYQPISLDVAGV